MLARLEIDLGALRHNARTLAAVARPARLLGVLKANAYGHGLVPVASALAGHVDRFGVYALEEAVALRAAGIRVPILIMGPVEPAGLDAAHASGAAIALWETGRFRDAVVEAAGRAGAPFPVHAKIDTGVTRLGLDAEAAPDALRRFLTTPELRLEGIFSHLAAAEELDSAYTERQLETFGWVLDAVQYELADLQPGPIRHIAASAAAMLWPQTRLDMVRVGIALYGLWPSRETRTFMNGRGLDLIPALRWTSELVAVRDVPAGTTIGYGRTFTASEPMRVGVLPIGYAEGVPRAASNRGAVLVDGVRCPIVGRVCMDMTMLDVTGVRAPRPGMLATLIGRDGEDVIAAEEWAEWAGTINYEIVARLPAHVPRTYVGLT